MYEAIDEAPGSILIVDEAGGQVRGFVSGGTGMRAIYRCMFAHPLRLGLALLPSLLRPRQIWRMVEVLRYGGGVASPASLPNAELLSIAVDPAWRGKGVSESLYRRLMAHFLASGVHQFRVTVGDALLPAHRFYVRMGAVAVGKLAVHTGGNSTVYVQECEPEAVSST